MNVTISIISKQCWDTMAEHPIEIKNPSLPYFTQLLEIIYKLYPSLNEGDFKLYWRYSHDYYIEIVDFITMATALNLMVKPQILLLLNDCEKQYPEIRSLLKTLDLSEMKAEVVRNRSKYDPNSYLKQKVEPKESEHIVEETEPEESTDSEILTYALRQSPEECFTADLLLRCNLINCVKKAMKGEIINCSAHKDIYFLETNTKNESTDLANLFASPAGREMFKYKPRPKLKHKLNPALDFFIQSQASSSPDVATEPNSKPSSCQDDSKCPAASSSSTTTIENCSRSRRSSIDLYEEAASILGLTCAQTDDCKCLECQCHYFDFEEEIDFPTGSDYVVDHSLSCTIQ